MKVIKEAMNNVPEVEDKIRGAVDVVTAKAKMDSEKNLEKAEETMENARKAVDLEKEFNRKEDAAFGAEKQPKPEEAEKELKKINLDESLFEEAIKIPYFITKVAGEADSGDIYYLGNSKSKAIDAVNDCYPDWLDFGLGGGDSAPAAYEYLGNDPNFGTIVDSKDTDAAYDFFINNEDDFEEIYIGDIDESLNEGILLPHFGRISKSDLIKAVEKLFNASKVVDGNHSDFSRAAELIKEFIDSTYKDTFETEMPKSLAFGEAYSDNVIGREGNLITLSSTKLNAREAMKAAKRLSAIARDVALETGERVEESVELEEGRTTSLYDKITKELYSANPGGHGGVDGQGRLVAGTRYENEQVVPCEAGIRVVANDPKELDLAKQVADYFNAPVTDIKEFSSNNELKAGKYYVDITIDESLEENKNLEIDEDYNLVGQDSNAYALMGYTANAMKECGLSDEVDEMLEKAKSSDYNNLLVVCNEYIQKCNKIVNDYDDDFEYESYSKDVDELDKPDFYTESFQLNM